MKRQFTIVSQKTAGQNCMATNCLYTDKCSCLEKPFYFLFLLQVQMKTRDKLPNSSHSGGGCGEGEQQRAQKPLLQIYTEPTKQTNKLDSYVSMSKCSERRPHN